MNDHGPFRKKVEHFDQPGDAHFLTFSCYRRLPLLLERQAPERFVAALGRARDKHDFDLWAWVIMPEHVHLLIRPRRPEYRIASILADVKRSVGMEMLADFRKTNPSLLARLFVREGRRLRHRFWQAGPGTDRNVFEPATALRIMEYIHNNPVLRGLVAAALDWQWSSARAWAGWSDVVLSVDRTLPILGQFPGWEKSS